jgi:aspartate carbamoyltransferase catalytic subunit
MIETNKEITVKFHPDMVRAMFDCGKDMTSRFQKLGKVGDKFTLIHPDTLEQRKWQIIDINRHTLGEVTVHMHKQEGFISEKDFMKFWVKIHPERIDPRLKVYVHILKQTEED